MVDAALLSSNDTTWQSPEVVLDCIRHLDVIGLDPCTVESNPVGAEHYLTPEYNGLGHSWQDQGLVFMNPPYGRGIRPWIDKAIDEAERGVEIVALIPSRTGTRWFLDFLMHSNVLCLIKGRLKFGGAANSAPFDSALLYFGPRHWKFIDAVAPLGFCIDRAGGFYGPQR